MRRQKGFTLIELLVVIAIIGLLASLAVVSLNSARNKGYDAQIKSDLSQVRTDVEVETNATGDYTGYTIPTVLVPPSCSDDAAYNLSIAVDNTAYAAWADMCNATGDFCVDSTGQAVEVAAGVTAGATVCP